MLQQLYKHDDECYNNSTNMMMNVTTALQTFDEGAIQVQLTGET